MSRLLMLLMLLALVCAVVYLLVRALGIVAQSGRARLEDARPGNVMVQRTSHVVLLALIVYAALWGAG